MSDNKGQVWTEKHTALFATLKHEANGKVTSLVFLFAKLWQVSPGEGG